MREIWRLMKAVQDERTTNMAGMAGIKTQSLTRSIVNIPLMPVLGPGFYQESLFNESQRDKSTYRS